MCHLVKYSVHIEWMITIIVNALTMMILVVIVKFIWNERNILLHPLRSIQDNWRSNFTHLSYVSPFGNSYTEFYSFIGIELQFFNPSGMFVAHFPTNIFMREYLDFVIMTDIILKYVKKEKLPSWYRLIYFLI